MAVRRILTYPESFLRTKSDEVRNITGETVKLIDDMVQTMYAAPGVGLAAPQLGIGERIIVLDVGEPDDDDDLPSEEAAAAEREPGRNLIILINPRVAEGEGEIVWEEGCLSVIDLRAEVVRAARILVKGWDLDQREVEFEAEGLLAVALQHEIDHLEGRLFIDHLSPLKRELYIKRVRKALREGRPIAREPRSESDNI